MSMLLASSSAMNAHSDQISFFQTSEPFTKTSMRNANVIEEFNGNKNSGILLPQEESQQRINKRDGKARSSLITEGEPQKRLPLGCSEDSSPSSSETISHHTEHSSSPPKETNAMCSNFSLHSKKRNIAKTSSVAPAKVQSRLCRNVLSGSSQCLLVVVLATVQLCGAAAAASSPSCFRCGLKPSLPHRTSSDERPATRRHEAKTNAANLSEIFAKEHREFLSEGSSLGPEISGGPALGDSLLGQLCGPKLNCGPGLECRYSVPATLGVCREAQKLPCNVNGTTYDDGATFQPDCRTECTCTGGTYACVSLCPEESQPPSHACRNPALRPAAGRCCRQWTCDPDTDTADQARCEASVSRWSACSSLTCGLGLSQRWATDQVSCRPVLQTRLCQLRPCRPESALTVKRHIRRSHHCKATIRTDSPERLVAGPCVSQRRYRVKRCNTCPGACCSDFMDTSIEVPFLCPLHSVPPYLVVDSALSPVDQASLFDIVTDSDTREGRLGDLTVDRDDEYVNVTAANYEVVVKQVQWIVRCRCNPTCQTPQVLSTASTTLEPDFNFGDS